MIRTRPTYAYYKAIIERSGGSMTPNGATVLGIRGEDIKGHVHDTTSVKAYDDTIIVLGADQSITAFPATTHPAQRTSSQSPGGNVGEIVPGCYIAEPHGLHNGIDSYHICNPDGSDHLPGWRDYNHDGVMDPDEKHRSETQHDNLTEVLVHASKRKDVPTSIGCQVLSPRDQRRFIDAVGGKNAHFNYILLDAHEIPGGIAVPGHHK